MTKEEIEQVVALANKELRAIVVAMNAGDDEKFEYHTEGYRLLMRSLDGIATVSTPVIQAIPGMIH